MTAVLAGWLLACIAADETAARAATAGPWRAVDTGYGHDAGGVWSLAPGVEPDSEWEPRRSVANENGRGDVDLADAVHIARWDPVRVLAECAAKRALIAGVAGDPFDALGAEGAYEWLVLGCLAVGFADRPGFREEWRR